jgi:hypothetical protein
MADPNGMAGDRQDHYRDATAYEKQHPGVGFTFYLGIGLIVFTVLMLLLALIMIGVSGPLGEP